MCVVCLVEIPTFVSSILLSLASGDGEKILQFCPSFHIVQKMREGQTPQQACDSIVSNMKERSGKWFEVAFIALDTKVSNLFIPGFKFDIKNHVNAETWLHGPCNMLLTTIPF